MEWKRREENGKVRVRENQHWEESGGRTEMERRGCERRREERRLESERCGCGRGAKEIEG